MGTAEQTRQWGRGSLQGGVSRPFGSLGRYYPKLGLIFQLFRGRLMGRFLFLIGSAAPIFMSLRCVHHQGAQNVGGFKFPD